MDLLFKDDEIIAFSPPAAQPAPAPLQEDAELFPETLPTALSAPTHEEPALSEPEEEYYEEEEEPAVAHYEPEPEPPAPEPVPAPAPVRDRPRIEDFIRAAPTPVAPSTTTPRPAVSPLAAVVARTNLPPEDLAYAPPANAVVSKRPLNTDEQPDLGFSNQDRGRFKDTEPALASGGEDLDVPTWMRLKRKLKR